MNADGFVINPSKVVKHLLSLEGQKPITQIYWGNAKTLFQTAEILVEKYANDFSGIELNTGCPSNTVMKCGWGSDMLKHRPETIEIIRGLSEIVHRSKNLTFSIKSRAGLNEEDKAQQLKFLTEVAQYCDLITIHGRTLKQLYTGDADFDFIYQVKRQVSCPVIANGGISSYDQAQELEKKRWFDALMIGQGAIWNPWVFTSHQPSLEEKIQVIKEHLEIMIACELRFEIRGERIEEYRFKQPQKSDLECLKVQLDPEKEYRSIVEFRKYLFQYIKGISNSREWKQAIIPIKTYGEIVKKVEELIEIGG